MPKIPTTASSASILGSGFSTSAPEGAFGVSLEGLSRGLSTIAPAIAINAKQRAQIEERDKQKEDNTWLTKALSEYGRGLTDFEVNPENRNRVDYLPQFMKHADGLGQSFLEKAPSSEAYDAFLEKSAGIVDQRYQRTAAQSADNEMKADFLALDDSWGNAMQSYHSMAPIDAQSAASDLLFGLDVTTQGIIANYGEYAPEVAKKMVGQKIEDTVLALSEKNPTLARELLDGNAAYIDETKRQVLLNKLEQKKTEGSLLLKEDFNNVREKTLIEANRSGNYTEIPLEHYQAVFDGEQAQVQKMRDDSKGRASVEAHGLLSQVKGMVPAEKMKMAEELEKKMTSADQLQAFGQIIAPAIREDAELYGRDPVAWQMANNPVVQVNQNDMANLMQNNTAADGGPGVLPPLDETAGPPGSVKTSVAGITEVPTPDQARASQEQYYRSILRYQGAPLEGEDPRRFMNRPRSQQHIMTKTEAESAAAQINGADIDNVIGVINGLVNKYPTDDLRAQAISDLTTLPQNKIKPEYAIAFQNRDQPWLPEFIGNIRSVKDLESMNKVDQAKVRSGISSNGLWNSFRSTMMGPQNQRSGEIDGYFNAIEVDVRAMVAQGKSVKDAVEVSVNRILASTMKPAELRGAGSESALGYIDWDMWGNKRPQLWIPTKPDGFTRTLSQPDIDNYAQRMGVALAEIHPDDVDPSQFPGYQQNLNDSKRQRLIHNQIVKTGSYYPEPGGAYWRVTVESASGQRIDLRDKEGRFFRLPLKNVPSYAVKGKYLDGVKMKGLTPSTWSLEETEHLVDYPKGWEPATADNNWERTYPKTGNFWELVK